MSSPRSSTPRRRGFSRWGGSSRHPSPTRGRWRSVGVCGSRCRATIASSTAPRVPSSSRRSRRCWRTRWRSSTDGEGRTDKREREHFPPSLEGVSVLCSPLSVLLSPLRGLVATSYDVIILGGGPAGYVCAIRAAQLGLSTAVVEKDKLGGVCVNIGCIPTKALLHSAYVANLVAHDAKDLGVAASGVTTDYAIAMRRSRKVADQNSKGVELLMKKHKITVIKGTGTLGKNRIVRVGNDEYQAKKAVVIATGSRVKGIPQIGLEINKTTVISSDEALFLEQAPKSLAV